MGCFKSFLILFVVLVASTSARPSATEEGKRLIKVSEAEPAAWLSQEEILLLISNRINFMDITDFPTVTRDPAAPSAFPAAIRFQSTVRGLFSQIDIPYMTSFVTRFSAYNNRYYQSQTGVQSSEWLLSILQEAIDLSGRGDRVTAFPFEHDAWAQNSVIARIQGSESGRAVVILGAHQDSVNSGSPANGRSPGADDNASGSVALLEAFLILLNSGIIPKKSIEFQWYAAEEVGLRGSQAIAQMYASSGAEVVAMMNYDVVGYNVGRSQIALITDYTDGPLNAFLRILIDEYLTFTWVNDTCGYACSDHASYFRAGFPAAMPNEAVSFPYMHTTRDTIDQVNFNQVQEFVKLALGYSIELAEL